MGIRILFDATEGCQCMYCSTTMQAFGPVFDADEDVDDFFRWWDSHCCTQEDPRQVSASQLESFVEEWRAQKQLEAAESLDAQ